MDVKYINPFLAGLKNILNNFDPGDIKVGNLQKKENMNINMDITAVVGIIGDIKGNIAYCLNKDTAKKIVSAMMEGTEVTEIDQLARSAISELSNMITANSSAIFYKSGIHLDITPPSLIIGSDIYLIISSVQTVAVDMVTPFGKIEINIGLEV